MSRIPDFVADFIVCEGLAVSTAVWAALAVHGELLSHTSLDTILVTFAVGTLLCGVASVNKAISADDVKFSWCQLNCHAGEPALMGECLKHCAHD